MLDTILSAQELVEACRRLAHREHCPWRPVACRHRDRGCVHEPCKKEEKAHAASCHFRPHFCPFVKQGCPAVLSAEADKVEHDLLCRKSARTAAPVSISP